MDNLVLVGGGLLLLTDKLQQIQNPYSLTKRRFAARAHFSLLQYSTLHYMPSSDKPKNVYNLP